MPRTELRTRISIDHVHCRKEQDAGSAEPYLWAVLFKADGETVTIGSNGRPEGVCKVFGTDGSQGNLGTRDVDAGDRVVVPWRIGEFRTSLRPILHSSGAFDAPGVLGLVMALMEEDAVTPDGARAAYATLVDFVKKTVDEKIPTWRFGQQNLPPAEIKDLIEQAKKEIKKAIFNVQGTWDNVRSMVNPDDTIGFELFVFSQDDLADNFWDVSRRFQERTTEGVVLDDWQVLGESEGARPSPHDFTHARRSEDVGAPRAAGAPITILQPSGTVSIVYPDTSGHLQELSRDAIGQIGWRDLSTAANAPLVGFGPFAYLDTSQVIVPYGISPFGAVHALRFTNDVVAVENLSGSVGAPSATSTPVGTFNPATNRNHIIYQSLEHLHVLHWAGASDPVHYGGQISPPEHPAAGGPSAYFNNDNTNIVVYRGTDAHIHSLAWSTGGTEHADLSAVAVSPPAAGNPVAYYIASMDLNQVTYRGTDGHLHELFWPGANAVAGWDLTTASGAPEALSDPAVFYSAGTNTKHVIYRGASDHLYEISWMPGGQPTFVDLTLAALAPRAVDGPAALTFDGANLRSVVYRGVDHHIHEISWTANPNAAPRREHDWRWCSKCQGLFFGGLVASSACAAGGTHSPAVESRSPDYVLSRDIPASAHGQSNWRWCSKCQGLFFGGYSTGRCPAGGGHSLVAQSGSGDYVLAHSVPPGSRCQDEWHWCSNCQGLFYGWNAASSRCPAGGTHVPRQQNGSVSYVLRFTGML